MTKIFLLAITAVALTFSIASCQNGGGESLGEGYSVLPQDAFKERLATSDDYLLLDVRTPEEYGEGHIEGALNVNILDSEAFEAGVSQLDSDKTLMIYCRSGNRSRKAAEKLQALGFEKIYDLEGGFKGWEH